MWEEEDEFPVEWFFRARQVPRSAADVLEHGRFSNQINGAILIPINCGFLGLKLAV